MPAVSIVDKATGQVIARKRSSLAGIAAWQEQFDPTAVDIKPEWLELPAVKAPVLKDIRRTRDRLLDTWAWTVRADSPLTAKNQQAWMRYLRQLHRVTKNLTDAATVVWPEQPALEYAEDV